MESYRLGRQVRIFLPFFYLFAAVIVVAAIISMSSTGDSGGLIFLIVWSVGVATHWWTILRMPWRIETDDREIRFVARTRRIAVPWEDLRSVTSPWYDINRTSIRWEWGHGKVRTMGPWDAQHRLLATIEERAPSVVIKGL